MSDNPSFDEGASGIPALNEPEFPPNPEPGIVVAFNDAVYRFVQIHGGARGGRWAYWDWKHIGNQDFNYSIIVDVLFSMGPLLAGVLLTPWNGVDSTCWIKMSPIVPPPPDEKIYIEPIERGEGRYERNDVDRIARGPVDE